MNQEEYIRKLLADNQVIDHIFDSIRLIDLRHYKICKVEEQLELPASVLCYQTWGRSHPCENCIGYRAVHENGHFVKLEPGEKSVYLLMAIPVMHDGEAYVLELMKDITQSMVVCGEEPGNLFQLSSLVEQLNTLVYQDSFTQLYNKQYIEKQLPLDMADSRENHTPLTAVMIDLDNFKCINDRYGHNMGDQVIRAVSALLRKHAHKHDCWVARFGGEEFLIVCRNKTGEQVFKQCTKLKKHLNELEFQSGEKTVRVSASFGVYQFDPQRDTLEDFLEKADRKLYESKSRGKDIITK